MNNNSLRYFLAAFLALALLSGCASTSPAVAQQPESSSLLERYNRAVFSFNQRVDKTILKPVARGYQAVTPDIVDRGISNFFSNLNDVIVIANNVLQLKIDKALQDTNRLAVNSTFGLLGFFDVATAWGLPKNNEDFGQTLGYWGVGEGYYIVLPLLGPTTTRDIWRLPVDGMINPIGYVDPTSAEIGLRVLEVVDFRADLLQAEQALGDAALDQYTFQREAYLQRRQSLVLDGQLSETEDEDALFDELDDLDDFDTPEPSATEPALE